MPTEKFLSKGIMSMEIFFRHIVDGWKTYSGHFIAVGKIVLTSKCRSSLIFLRHRHPLICTPKFWVSNAIKIGSVHTVGLLFLKLHGRTLSPYPNPSDAPRPATTIKLHTGAHPTALFRASKSYAQALSLQCLDHDSVITCIHKSRVHVYRNYKLLLGAKFQRAPKVWPKIQKANGKLANFRIW